MGTRNYLRTMNTLLEQDELEERKRKRIKQLEQQRALNSQIEEKRQQKALEEMMKKKKEEKDEIRVFREREILRKRFELEKLREQQARHGQPDVPVKCSPCIYRDMAVQTTCSQRCGHHGEACFTPTTAQSLTEDEVTSLREVFCCLVCQDSLHKPMFASCCRSLVGCKECILKWNKDNNGCPKCRAENLRDKIYEVTGLYEALAPLDKLFL